jgi:hypothetical protein
MVGHCLVKAAVKKWQANRKQKDVIASAALLCPKQTAHSSANLLEAFLSFASQGFFKAEPPEPVANQPFTDRQPTGCLQRPGVA